MRLRIVRSPGVTWVGFIGEHTPFLRRSKRLLQAKLLFYWLGYGAFVVLLMMGEFAAANMLGLVLVVFRWLSPPRIPPVASSVRKPLRLVAPPLLVCLIWLWIGVPVQLFLHVLCVTAVFTLIGGAGLAYLDVLRFFDAAVYMRFAGKSSQVLNKTIEDVRAKMESEGREFNYRERDTD